MTTIPVGESGFSDCLAATGLIEVSMRQTITGNRRGFEFALATPIDNDTKAVLYSPSKPTPRSFQSLGALSATLRKFGLERINLPLEPGSIVSNISAPLS